MEERRYQVAGAIVAQGTDTPVEGLTVQAFDKDFFREQPLGQAITDRAGRYQIEFGRQAFTGPIIHLEREPDIFLEIRDVEGHLITSTETTVVVNPGSDTSINVAVPWTGKPDTPGLSHISGEPVNLVVAAQLSVEDLVQAYRYRTDRTIEFPNMKLVQKALPGLFAQRPGGFECAEGRADILRVLLEERGAFADIGELDESDADDFPSGTTVKTFYTANIAVKYTTDAGSVHAVDASLPAADATLSLPDGTNIGTIRSNLAALHPANTEVAPTYVQKIGLIAVYALGRFINPPFSLRDPRAGSARLEYRILEQGAGFAGGTNASWSHVEVDPNNSDAQNFGTVPHEMFHQVQYRYNATTTRSGIYGILREGGARLAEDSVNDLPNRYVDSGKLIFDQPNQTMIDLGGASTPIRYAAGLFWKYYVEQHSTLTGAAAEPAIGVDAYRTVLEETATVQPGDPGIGYTTAGLRSARRRQPWYGSLDEFGYYDPARTELGSHETTWGNYLIANYLHGTAMPSTDSRFDYKEDDEPVTSTVIATLSALQSAVLTGDEISTSQGSNVVRSVAGHLPWAARFYRVTPSGTSPPRMLRIALAASAGMTDPLIQILRIGPANALLDVHRSDLTSYAKTINMAGLQSVVVIVASRDTGGDFQLTFQEVATATDVMVTRWNTRVGTEYEVNPAGWSWTWVSPDVMVDTDDDLAPDPMVFFGQNNKLKIRLRNRGNANATGIRVDLWYQKATPFLTSAGWIPITNAAGAVQSISSASLAAGAEQWFSVDWAPVDDGTHHPHWCVKALVSATGDPNPDNKMVLSNFGHVIVPGEGDRFDLLIRYLGDSARREIFVAPHGGARTLRVEETIGLNEKERREAEPCWCDRTGTTILPIPNRAAMAKLAVSQDGPLRAWDEREREHRPTEGVYYPIDPLTLPPGVDSEELVTVAYREDGVIRGGVTYRLVKRPT